MRNLIKAVIAVAAITAMSSAAQAKRYCCSNPAICNAVCGAACCGSDLAAKAQTQDKMSKRPVAAKPSIEKKLAR